MSENRSLAVLEVLVHLSGSIPDRYMLGSAEVPGDLAVEVINECDLEENWSTLSPREQVQTRTAGDEWVKQRRSAILSVPSAIVGERSYVLNPAHPEFMRITFARPVPFRFDIRLQGPRSQTNVVDTIVQ